MSTVSSTPKSELSNMDTTVDEKVNKDQALKDDAQKVKKVATDMRSKLMEWLWKSLCMLGNCILYVGFYSLVSSILAYRIFPMFQNELQKFPHYQSISPDVIFTRFWEWVTFYHTIQWVDNIVTGGRLQKFLKEKASSVQLAQS